MSNVNFEKVSPSYAKLTLTITKEEIESKLKSELTKAQRTASLRGFRKGKVPMSTMYKIFGNQTLMNYLDSEVDNSLKAYIEENKINTLFAPFPAEDHEPEAIDVKTIKNLSLKYELVLSPEIQLEMPPQVFERFEILPDLSLIEEQIERMKKEHGKTEDLVEGDIQENDILQVAFTEVKDGEAVVDGVTNETTLLLESVTEKLQAELKGQTVGYTTTVDIFEVETNTSTKSVYNHLLEVEEDDSFESTFELKVVGIKRLVPAEMNEDFFLHYDPSGGINSEEKLRDFLEKDFKGHFDQEDLQMLKVRVQDEVVKHIEVPFDEDLLLRVYDGAADKFDQFVKGLRWVVIREKFIKANEIVPQESDLLAATKKRLAKMLGGNLPAWMDESVIRNFMERTLKDPNQREELLEEVINELVLDRMADQVKVEVKEVGEEGFKEAIRAFNEEFASKATAEEE